MKIIVTEVLISVLVIPHNSIIGIGGLSAILFGQTCQSIIYYVNRIQGIRKIMQKSKKRESKKNKKTYKNTSHGAYIVHNNVPG